jgi:hypothetical protein
MSYGIKMGGRIERCCRTASEITYAAESAVKVWSCFHVNDGHLAPCVNVGVKKFVGVGNHEMSLKHYVYMFSTRRNDIGPKGQVGYKVAIHDIPLNAVHARCFESDAFLSKSRKVRW